MISRAFAACACLLSVVHCFHVTTPSIHSDGPSIKLSPVADISADDIPTNVASETLAMQKSNDRSLPNLGHLPWMDQLDVHSALMYAWEEFGQKDSLGIIEYNRAQSIASILSRLDVERDLIIAGILTNALERKDVSQEDFCLKFGSKVCDLIKNVDEVKRVERIAQSFSMSQTVKNQKTFSGNLRNLILCVSSSWDSLFLKIVSHLNDYSTIDQLCRKKQKILARQSLEVYAPLAHRMGANRVKNELESLGFRYLYPRSFQSMMAQLQDDSVVNSALLSAVMEKLQEAIQESPKIQESVKSVTVNGRCKEPYSIWRKMVRKNQPLNRILDAVAVRIIIKPTDNSGLNEQDLCYMMRDLVQEMWPIVESRSKDYVSEPKKNGYQSLHSTVEIPYFDSCFPVEIQIRTDAMHQTAEYGMAAHFTYKEGDQTVNPSFQEHEVFNRKQLIQVLHNDLRQSKVFVFGPCGAVLDFDRGTTISDVRKQLIRQHMNSGQKSFFSSQTKINGKKKGKSYQLGDGDVLSLH